MSIKVDVMASKKKLYYMIRNIDSSFIAFRESDVTADDCGTYVMGKLIKVMTT